MVIKLKNFDFHQYRICYFSPHGIDDTDILFEIEDSAKKASEYVFIQIKNQAHIINDKKETIQFEAGTIFFLCDTTEKASHSFLAKCLLKLSENQLLSAGRMKIENGKLTSWNLRSYYYWQKLNLKDEAIAEQVGLPMTLFQKIENIYSYQATSPPLLFKEKSPTERDSLLRTDEIKESSSCPCCCTIL